MWNCYEQRYLPLCASLCFSFSQQYDKKRERKRVDGSMLKEVKLYIHIFHRYEGFPSYIRKSSTYYFTSCAYQTYYIYITFVDSVYFIYFFIFWK